MNDQKLEPELEEDNGISAKMPRRSSNDRTFTHNLNEEEMLRIYIGPNADKFLKLYHKENKKKFSLNINWSTLLLPLVWFFYRKMYLMGSVIYSIPFATIIFFPDLKTSYYTAYYGAISGVANSLYLDTAKKRIKDIDTEGISSYEVKKRLAEAGGTTRIGALFAFLIYVSLGVFLLFSVLYAPPECDSSRTKEFIKDAITSVPSNILNGQVPEVLNISHEKQIGKTKVICSLNIRSGENVQKMYLSFTQNKKSKSHFHTQLFDTLDEAIK